MLNLLVLLLVFYTEASLGFMYGLASAPAHVEDELNDPWLDFALEGNVRAFKNQTEPEKRLRFWTDPQKELELLKELKIDIYRMGLSWTRLVPEDPFNEKEELVSIIQDEEAFLKYETILDDLKNADIKIMLTLFHHSMPKWAHQRGGMQNELVQKAFVMFSLEVMKRLTNKVDFWITFNEANVYALMTHILGAWPYGKKSIAAGINSPIYKGRFFTELDGMIKAHNEIYDGIKKDFPSMKISIAHNYASYQGVDFIGKLISLWPKKNMNEYFVDGVKEKIDFLGMNYYGAEFFSFKGLIFKKDRVYSEAGRAVSPEGFLEIMLEMHERYQKKIFITENGIADRTDIVRKPYLIEHLHAIELAKNKGVDVLGYIHWTLSDNWEWADGYCPKFGLVEVDRERNQQRVRRESFYIYQEIIAHKNVDIELRENIWEEFLNEKSESYFLCRAEDQSTALDEARIVPLIKKDNWKINHI